MFTAVPRAAILNILRKLALLEKVIFYAFLRQIVIAFVSKCFSPSLESSYISMVPCISDVNENSD